MKPDSDPTHAGFTSVGIGIDRTPKVPDHELIRLIGQGAYGEIWLARNVMGVFRAVKTVYRARFKDAQPFEREFKGIQRYEPVSRTNEGLIDILQIGRNDEDAYFYYVMELADDFAAREMAESERGASNDLDAYVPHTLSEELRHRKRLPVDECLRILLPLNLALGHLHRHGLLHRDIKPSNLIFVHGVPKLADIGLVTGETEAESYVGTEGFIPPEGPNSRQADIYGLGKVLYEMGMGKDRKEFPEPATLMFDRGETELLMELNAVILKACASRPERRYQSAEEMHEDLALLQNHKSVRRKHQQDRRLRQLMRLGAVAAVLGVLGVSAFLYQRHQTSQVRELMRRVEVQAGENEKLAAERGENLLQLSEAAVVQHLNAGEVEEAVAAIGEALALASQGTSVEERQLVRLRFLAQSAPKKLLEVDVATPQPDEDLGSDARDLCDFSSSLPRLVIPDGGSIRLVDTDSGAEVARLSGGGFSPAVAFFDRTGRRVLGFNKHFFRVWSAEDGRALSPIIDARVTGYSGSRLEMVRAELGGSWPGGSAELVQLSPDGQTVYGSALLWYQSEPPGSDSAGFLVPWVRIHAWDVSTGERLWTYAPPHVHREAYVHSFDVHPAGERLAVAVRQQEPLPEGGHWRIDWLDAKTGEVDQTLATPAFGGLRIVGALSLSGSGRYLLVKGHPHEEEGQAPRAEEDLVQVWETNTQTLVSEWRAKRSAGVKLRPPASSGLTVSACAWNPDGQHIAWFAGDRVLLHRLGTEEPVQTWQLPEGFRSTSSPGPPPVIWSPDETSLAVGTAQGTVEFFSMGDHEPASHAVRMAAPVHRLDWNHDGSALLTVAADRKLVVWGMTSSGETTTLRCPSTTLLDIDLSSDGRWLAACGQPGEAWLWNVEGTPSLQRLELDTEYLGRMQFDPQSRALVATAFPPFQVKYWNLDELDAARDMTPVEGASYLVTFAPSGRRFAVFGGGRTVAVYEPQSGPDPVCTFSEDRQGIGPIEQLAGFLGDDYIVSTAYQWLSVHRIDQQPASLVWDWQNGMRRLTGLDTRPDQNGFLVHDDRAVTVFDASELGGEHEMAPGVRLAHYDQLNDARFSPDGRRVLTASANGVAYVWQLPSSTSPDGEATTLRPVDAFRTFEHRGVVVAVVWSPDGRTVAVGTDLNAVRVWEVESGQPLSPAIHVSDLIAELAFTPDGRRLVAATADGAIKFWEIATPTSKEQ